jgi:hypothetical protein
MADLCDIDHTFGQDIGVTPTGDIALASKSDRTIQRVIRRLLTPQTDGNSSAYPWEPDYGAGLAAKIGDTLDIRAIRAIVLSQLLAEASVAKIPAPTVTVTAIDANSAMIDVTYFDQSGTPQNFGFDLSP